MFTNSRRKGPQKNTPITLKENTGLSALNDFIKSEQNSFKDFKGLNNRRRNKSGMNIIKNIEIDKSKNELKESIENFSFNKNPHKNKTELKEETYHINKFDGINNVTKFGNKSRPITPIADLNVSQSSSNINKTPLKLKPFVINKFADNTIDHNTNNNNTNINININNNISNQKTNNKLDLNISAKDLKKKNIEFEKEYINNNKKEYDGKLKEIKTNLKEEVVDEDEYGFDEFEKDDKLLQKLEDEQNKINIDDEDDFGKGQEFLNLEEELRQPDINYNQLNKRDKTLKRLSDLKGVIELDQEYFNLYEFSNDAFDFDKNILYNKTHDKYYEVATNTDEMYIYYIII